MISIYHRCFPLNTIKTTTRLFQTYSKRQNLFDPFKPTSSSGKNILNKIPNTYKLIYAIPSQRATHFSLSALCLTSLFVAPIPLTAAIIELTGLSKFSEVEPNFLPIIVFCSLHFTLIGLLAFKVKKSTVFRIYADDAGKNFSMITFGKRFSLNVEHFTKENMKFKYPSPDEVNLKRAIYQMYTKLIGNFMINGKLRSIQANNFVNDVVCRKMIGERAFNVLKSSSQKK